MRVIGLKEEQLIEKSMLVGSSHSFNTENWKFCVQITVDKSGQICSTIKFAEQKIKFGSIIVWTSSHNIQFGTMGYHDLTKKNL
jgi:hypothetical protein